MPYVRASQAREALQEAVRRSPDSAGALTFLYVASGLGQRTPSKTQLERALRMVENSMRYTE